MIHLTKCKIYPVFTLFEAISSFLSVLFFSIFLYFASTGGYKHENKIKMKSAYLPFLKYHTLNDHGFHMSAMADT